MAATTEETFPRVGALGLPVFVGLRGMDIPELRGPLQAYRKAWQEAGHAGNGNVFLRVPVYAGVTEQGALEETQSCEIRPPNIGTSLWCKGPCAFSRLRGRGAWVPILWGELCVMWDRAGAVQSACVPLWCGVPGSGPGWCSSYTSPRILRITLWACSR
jgi:hypothetical protein